MKAKRLDRQSAQEITGNVITICEELGITGTVIIVDRHGNLLDEYMIGDARHMTRQIAILKAKQSAYTGEKTGIIAKNIENGTRTLELYGINPRHFVPFAGGCPITDKKGNILGGGGFSEQTAQTDEHIIATAIRNAGFLADSPQRTDIPEDKITRILIKE